MITPAVVAICAPYKRNGKSTIAEHLVSQYGYTKIALVDKLRDMLILLLDGYGVPASEIHRYINIDKEEIIPEVGASYRRLATTLGTEWGRDTINKNLWTNLTIYRIKKALEDGKHVVIDDLRFVSEFERLKLCLPLTTWRVIRPGFYPNPTLHKIRRFFYWVPFLGVHRSEGALNDIPVDATLINDTTELDLRYKVDGLIFDWDKEMRPTLEDEQ